MKKNDTGMVVGGSASLSSVVRNNVVLRTMQSRDTNERKVNKSSHEA